MYSSELRCGEVKQNRFKLLERIDAEILSSASGSLVLISSKNGEFSLRAKTSLSSATCGYFCRYSSNEFSSKMPVASCFNEPWPMIKALSAVQLTSISIKLGEKESAIKIPSIEFSGAKLSAPRCEINGMKVFYSIFGGLDSCSRS